jgi:LPXTG-motif cell wall-anchored protein
MGRRGHRIACLLTAALLALPAAAWGQSAGDEQYEDPFAPGTEEPQATPEAAPAPAAGGESSAPAPAPAPDPAPEANAAQQLPYTGADVEIVLAAGAALLAGGVALRIRVRA